MGNESSGRASTVMTNVVLAVCALAIVLVLGAASWRKAARMELTIERLHGAAAASRLIGTRLPSVQLIDVDGNPVHFDGSPPTGVPTIILLIGPDDCYSCGEYGLEMRILRGCLGEIPQLAIGIGKDSATLRRYLRAARIPALLDPNELLFAALEFRYTPVIGLVDSDGRFLLVNPRPGQLSRDYPISRLMLRLEEALSPAIRETTPLGRQWE